jgi:hypothetical protein
MATQLLIYENVEPLSWERHRDCCVEWGEDYSYSGKINAVPLMATEFPHAASEYAIAFTRTGEDVLPAVILGLKPGQNLYLSQKAWTARYIPAFVRRYPFVFAPTPDGQGFVLCVDETFSGFNRDGRGQRLFDEQAKATPYVDDVLKFVRDYEAQYRRAREFCGRIRQLGLLDAVEANIALASGEKLSLNGMLAVNRAKLQALPAEQLAELVKTGELELLYLHLQSMRNIGGLTERLTQPPTGAFPGG